MVYFVTLCNTLVVLGSLASCCYLTINDHVCMAVVSLLVPLYTMTDIRVKK